MQVKLHLSVENAERFCRASQDAHATLHHAEAVFDLIGALIMDGDHAEHPGVPAAALLASRALQGLYQRNPDALFDLSQILKEALLKGGTE